MGHRTIECSGLLHCEVERQGGGQRSRPEAWIFKGLQRRLRERRYNPAGRILKYWIRFRLWRMAAGIASRAPVETRWPTA